MLEVIKKGVKYTYSYVFVQKILRFAQILILARLLTPYDFGLSAIIILVFGTANTLLQSGIKKAIIYHQLTDVPSLNTAWSFSVIRGVFLFAVLFFMAPYISEFFDHNDMIFATQCLAFNFILSGYTNIGMMVHTIKFKFKKIVIWEFTGFLLGVLVTIITAYLFRTYLAIIYGLITEQATRTISSYYFSSYRPKFNLDIDIFLRLFKYGKWMAADKIVSFASANQDKAFIGKALGVQVLGYYSIANQLGDFLSSIYSSLSKVFFPVFSKIHKSSNVNPKQIELYLFFIIATSIQFVTVISFYSEVIVKILYGEKWAMIGPFLQILIWASLIKIIQNALSPYFNGVGKPKYVLFINIFRIILLIPSLYILIDYYGIFGAIFALILVQIMSLLLILYFLYKITRFSFIRLIYVTIPLFVSIMVCFIFEAIFITTSNYVEIAKPILSIVVLFLITILFLRATKTRKYINGVFGTGI